MFDFNNSMFLFSKNFNDSHVALFSYASEREKPILLYTRLFIIIIIIPVFDQTVGSFPNMYTDMSRFYLLFVEIIYQFQLVFKTLE